MVRVMYHKSSTLKWYLLGNVGCGVLNENHHIRHCWGLLGQINTQITQKLGSWFSSARDPLRLVC